MLYGYGNKVHNNKKSRLIYIFNDCRELLAQFDNQPAVVKFTGIDQKLIPNRVKTEKVTQGYILSYYLEPRLKVETF